MTDHAAKAIQLLADRDEPGLWGTSAESIDEALRTAHVHATLALVDAITRLTDSYNGWKDLGK